MYVLLFMTLEIRFFATVITLSLFDDANTLLISIITNYLVLLFILFSIINIMTINERFAEILKAKNISVKEAAKLLDRTDMYVRKLMRPGESFGIEPVTKILNSIYDINPDWLLSEKGNMFRDKHLPTNTNGKGVPYFEDIEASCSILSMNMETPENPTFYIDYEHFNDCNAYIPVVGDSMYPQYCAGEIVAVKQIFNFDVIQWGEAYLIVTNSNANDLRTIKQIHYCDDESKIILRASNPNYKGDTKINKEDILSMFIIKGKIKRNQL